MIRLSPKLWFVALVAVASVGWAATGCSDADEQPEQSDDDSPDNAENDNDQHQSTRICEPGHSRCDGADAVQVCNEEGTDWEQTPCGDDERCDFGTAECTEQICEGGQFDGCTDDGRHRHCNASGTGWVEGDCPDGGECTEQGCSEPRCTPGGSRCGPDGSVQSCSEAGVWVASQVCSVGSGCFDGDCEKLCEISSKDATYIGCEYWSIDLDNYQDALSEPHAIIVTNYNEDLAADVELFEGATDRRILEGANGETLPATIPPGEARIYQIAPGRVHSGTEKFDDQAIRVSSSIPVVVHQFNPLNHVDVFSNDASLLLPTDSVGTEYRVFGWYNRSDRVELRGYVTMVNSSNRTTEVSVRPTAEVIGGPEIPRIEPGEQRSFELEPGQSLNLVSSGTELDDAQAEGCLADPEGTPDSVEPCPDLTGTHIESDEPITVFGGHQCANVLLGVDRCDHIESQLLPVDTWGTEYVGTKFVQRAEGVTPEPDIWRVIAAEEDTLLQTDPPIEGVHNRVLDEGEWMQFAAREHFELAADAPVALAQYMVGANWSGIPRVCDEGLDAFDPTGIGDPAMTVGVPTDQFREEYIVHTPENYDEDYLDVIVPAGLDVQIDGETIPASKWEIVGEVDRYEVATIEVEPGFHTLSAEEPFGVVGYGYACHVSYAYPGGMNLDTVDDGLPVP